MKENTKWIIRALLVVCAVIALAIFLAGCQKTTHNVVDRNRHDVVERLPYAKTASTYTYYSKPKEGMKQHQKKE